MRKRECRAKERVIEPNAILHPVVSNYAVKILSVNRFAFVISFVFSAITNAIACQCGVSDRGKNAWEIAKQQSHGAVTIFEGTPIRFELQWNVLSAKNGDFIQIDSPREQGGGPRMAITFRVARTYKGALGAEVQVKTGLGGGDCGARFSTGLNYLVYAFGLATDDLSVSVCSPGGWIGETTLAADLRFLRHQRPTAEDLKPYVPLWNRTPEEQQQQYEAHKKRYSAATGRVCGKVVSDEGKTVSGGYISFLCLDGYSPFDQPIASVDDKGLFCSDRLGPGKYYLYLNRRSAEAGPSALYYPGVNDFSKAASINVAAGQDSDVVFKAAPTKRYTVRGFISTNDRSTLSGSNVYVSLISLDGNRGPWRYEPVDFSGLFPLPRIKYFKFDGVPPGRYIAIASVWEQDWYTKKVELNVGTRTPFLHLAIVHTK